MRVFAGPNGSGKSTLQSLLPQSLLGFYINADEIEAKLRSDGHPDLSCYGVKEPLIGIREFLIGRGVKQWAQWTIEKKKLETVSAETGRMPSPN